MTGRAEGMSIEVPAHAVCQRMAEILADKSFKRGLSSGEFVSRLLVLYENCIATLYLRDFYVSLEKADWALAVRIVQAVQSLDYHGPRAEGFYGIFQHYASQVPDATAKWHLYQVLTEARKKQGFLTVINS